MRLYGLDQIRGLAVLFMLVFHFTYDLTLFGHVSLDMREGFWFFFPRLIVFLFLWSVGASLELVHGSQIHWSSFNRRLIKLTLIALVISLVTYLLFPTVWIFMGTIHCIALVSLMALPFLKFKKARWPVMLGILILQFGFDFGVKWMARLISRPSMDFIPPYPWFWVVLLGMISGSWILKLWPNKLRVKVLEVLGVHALKIYLIHQALFYALFSLFAWLQKSL
ncbi:MAG: DUF1624 domain-containing protein [Proteobacteria bacterium]|jgi:uncharacterized membrane protein|nr:DUF1624 domain-containing protein [Pseudomonadota bacterium]